VDKQKFWNEPNLSETDVKREHYVPQLLLRTFAVNGKIRILDLKDGKEHRTSIENAAVETHFYDMKIGDIQVSTEDWLAQLEGEAAPVIEKLLYDPDHILSLSVKEELHMARFFTALRFRTPAFRDKNEEMIAFMLQQIKEMTKKHIYHQYGKKKAASIWEEIEKKPDHWWFRKPEPRQRAMTTNFMLSEVQGFANILRAAPWRIGFTPDSIRLYTSDNPVAGYLTPIRIPGEGAAFSSFTYFVPLSPVVLLEIKRRPRQKGNKKPKPRGERQRGDFSGWEISFARHVVTNDARRYLFGEGPMIPKDCADSYLERIDRVRLEFAVRYLGFDPRPPWVQHD
jgi:hypothetical protein